MTVNDGVTDCLAILLTEDIVTEFNQLLNGARLLREAEVERETARARETRFRRLAEKSAKMIGKPNDQHEKARLNKDIADYSTKFYEEACRREHAEELLEVRQEYLKYSQELFQKYFMRAFKKAKLLEEPEIAINTFQVPDESETDYQSSVSSVQSSRSEPNSAVSNEKNDSILSLDALFKHMVVEDIRRKAKALENVEGHFALIEKDYHDCLAEFQEAARQGEHNHTRTEFDVIGFIATRELTQKLTAAEKGYESAVARGRALGMILNHASQESHFRNESDDGYRESREASAIAGVDRSFIKAWIAQVEEYEHAPSPNFVEFDEWDARTVELCDSVSLVDRSKGRKRIDRWREMCESMRV